MIAIFAKRVIYEKDPQKIALKLVETVRYYWGSEKSSKKYYIVRIHI